MRPRKRAAEPARCCERRAQEAHDNPTTVAEQTQRSQHSICYFEEIGRLAAPPEGGFTRPNFSSVCWLNRQERPLVIFRPHACEIWCYIVTDRDRRRRINSMLGCFMANARILPEHILVVDDDPRIRQMLSRYFEEEGYRVTLAGDGGEMRDCLDKQSIDIILLDLVLPGEDGLTLARDLRARSDVPIIMLTGRDDFVDRVVGLEVGADDYIAKPFHLREVLARVRGILRRRQPQASATVDLASEVYSFEGLRLDTARRQLTSDDGNEILLTTGEFDMLCILVKHAGRVLQRELLMDLTRGRNLEAFDRTIDAQIARLRRKIERDVSQPALIKSVRGVGYVFCARATRQEV